MDLSNYESYLNQQIDLLKQTHDQELLDNVRSMLSDWQKSDGKAILAVRDAALHAIEEQTPAWQTQHNAAIKQAAEENFCVKRLQINFRFDLTKCHFSSTHDNTYYVN